MPVKREDMRLVHRVASRFIRRNHSSERDDLLSDGMLALGLAAQKWEEDRALREQFYGLRENFLSGRIRHAMIDGIRMRNGRAHTDFRKQRFRENTLSLDAVQESGEKEARESMLERFVGEFDPGLENLLTNDVVEHMLSALPRREREVVERVVLGGERERMIAADFGVSESRVSQILSSALRRLRGEDVPMPRATRQHHDLSQRELEVLQEVANDKTNDEIAAELLVTQETVKSHLRHVNAKLGVKSRAGAVAIGFRLELLR